MSVKSKKKNLVSAKPLLLKDILIIEGHTRAGKFFLGKIIDGFERIEHYQYASIIDTVPQLELAGCLSHDVARYMLQAIIDEYAYYMRLGRNLNFRIADSSSILKSFDIQRYINRTVSECKNEDVLRDFKNDGRYATFVVHDMMANIKLFFDAFEHLKVVSILRHPVDLIYSWASRGWCQRESTDPFAIMACLGKGKNAVPWFAFNWVTVYKAMSQMDRIIYAIKNFSVLNQKSYQALKPQRKKRVLIFTYERLVQDPDTIVSLISRFLKTRPSKSMPAILKREGCYRKILPQDRIRKIQEIQKKASPKMFNVMMQLTDDYEKRAESGAWVQ